MNTIMKYIMFFAFLTMSFGSYAVVSVRVVDNAAAKDLMGVRPVQLSPGDLATKSLDELKDMCLNPQRYNLQSPLFKLEVTGVVTWSKWIKHVNAVYLIENQDMNTTGSFTKNGRMLDGSEWKISDGELTDVSQSNAACFVEGECVAYVKHIYTRDLVKKVTSCEDIAKSSSVEQLYGVTLESLFDITSIVPVFNAEDVTPLGFSDTVGETYPAACPKAEKPAGLELCKASL
ncbi:MAG: hypothetical protein HQK50_11545 [Oligoflexia bacterium]|nr:hypothetical protein [Oligoflexia bacterium]MBF0366198.1 hypothetical protein [Oligoflexia bacterium]